VKIGKFKLYHLLYLIPVVTVSYLFWQNTKPVSEVLCDVRGKTALCGALVPTSRVQATSDGAEILSEPVYFDVRLPRKYDKVTAEVVYSGLSADIFEFGIARDEAKKNFDFIALENKILDNSDWQKTESDGLVFMQKKAQYTTVADFLLAPPAFAETFVYRADLAPKLSDLAAKGETTIDFPIREGLKMLVYKKDGAPKINYTVIPAQAGISPHIDKIGANLYRVEIAGDKNLAFDNISINSPYVAILDNIKIGKLNESQEIFFAGSRLLARTETAGGVQKINAGGSDMDIAEAYRQYSKIFTDSFLKKITVMQGDVELGGTMFFIGNRNIFYPRYEALYSGADLSSKNFILAKYVLPIGTDIKIAQAAFDISGTPTPGGKLRFLLLLPNAPAGELVKVKNIKLFFSGQELNMRDIGRKILKKIW
jgi:hypothetical protein